MKTVKAKNAADVVAHRVQTAWERHMERQVERPRVAQSNRASELGHPCLRYLVLRRTAGDKERPPSIVTTALFREGRLHEKDIKRVLDDIGFPVYGSEGSFPPNDYNLTGHIDGMFEIGALAVERDGSWVLVMEDTDSDRDILVADRVAVRVGCEIKSLNPSHWAMLRKAEDMLRLAWFVQKWYTQAQIYMFLEDLPGWVFVIKNKLTGAWKLIPVSLDLAFVQECLDKAEMVDLFVEAGELPDYTPDRSVCRRCGFYEGVCRPDSDGGSLRFVTDEGLIEIAETVAETQQPAAVHRQARERLREIVAVMADGEDRVFSFGRAVVRARFSSKGALSMSVEALRGEDDRE